jgi:ribonuclease BN (tRNA processing enzyme)
VELTVLGCGGTWADPGGATSGYLIRQDGFNLWLDCGSGTLARLEQIIPMSQIDAVLVTHAHPDHFVDLYPCFYARHYAGAGEPGLPLFCPGGFFEQVGGLVSSESRDVMATAFNWLELHDGADFEIGPFRVLAREMAHIGVHALGYRIELVGGPSLAYSGDSGPNDSLVELAHETDLLLCEATWQEHMDLLPFHLSGRQAGEHASAAGAGRLMLTHIWPSLEKEASRAEATEAFAGPIDIAREGMVLEVGS